MLRAAPVSRSSFPHLERFVASKVKQLSQISSHPDLILERLRGAAGGSSSSSSSSTGRNWAWTSSRTTSAAACSAAAQRNLRLWLEAVSSARARRLFVSRFAGCAKKGYDTVLDACEDFASEWKKLKDGNSNLSSWNMTREEMEQRRTLGRQPSPHFDHARAQRDAADSLKKALPERTPLMRAKAKYGHMNSPLQFHEPTSMERQQKRRLGLLLIACGLVLCGTCGSSYFARMSHRRRNEWQNELHYGRKEGREYELVT